MATSSTTIIGNVTADPELKFSNDGLARLNFSVASTHYYTDSKGEKQEKVSFFNVVCWRYLAEDAARVLEKGIGAIVSGRLEQRSWEADDGTKRTTVELVADHVGVLARSIESLERTKRQDSGGGSEPAKKAMSPRAAKGPAKKQVPDDDPWD
jgi:single-strand DNA-binding protein